MCKIKKLFIKAAKKHVPSVDNICNDQYVGVIARNVGKWDWKCSSLYPYLDSSTQKTIRTYALKRAIKDSKLKKTKLPTIAIVLESPHTDEYKTKPPVPAASDTGKNFHSYFINMFSSWGQKYNGNLKQEYKILFINAIQYQCSLGAPTQYYRSKIFNAMWKEQKVKADFEKRLRKAQPAIVINCCTHGGISLRKRVQVSIDAVCSKSILLHAYHPSCWRKSSQIDDGGWTK